MFTDDSWELLGAYNRYQLFADINRIYTLAQQLDEWHRFREVALLSDPDYSEDPRIMETLIETRLELQDLYGSMCKWFDEYETGAQERERRNREQQRQKKQGQEKKAENAGIEAISQAGKILDIYRKNLAELEQQKALLGLPTPLSLVNQIQWVKAEIARLQAQAEQAELDETTR